MRKIFLSLFIVGVLLGGTLGLFHIARGQSAPPEADGDVVRQEVEGTNVRQIEATGDEPAAIGFVDSPTPHCYQPNPMEDRCFINWASMDVSAAPTSMRVLTVTIDGVGMVGRYQGYFQEAITVTHEMLGNGFQVACGAPGAADEPQLGHAYEWLIEAEDNGGSSTSNFGTLYCPPYTP